jgi:conserved hypothetical phage tail region protein
MANEYDLIPAFCFSVEFFNDEKTRTESRFQDVSGIGVELTVEEVEEGGLNSYVHKLPKRVKQSNLILKRALSAASSDLIKWAEDAIYDFRFELFSVKVSLLKLNEKKEYEPAKSWVFTNAYPVKIQYSDLNAKENALVIETLELAYSSSCPKKLTE